MSITFLIYNSTIVGHNDSVNAFYRYLSSSNVPPWLAGAMGVLAMAMVMSTLDTRAYVFISMVSKNILKIDPEVQLADYVDKTRLVTFMYFVTSILVAIFISDIVQYMLNTVTVFAILGPVLFVAVYGNSKIKYLDNVMLSVLIVGVAIFFVMLALGKLTTVLMTVMPIILTTIITAITYGVLYIINSKVQTLPLSMPNEKNHQKIY